MTNLRVKRLPNDSGLIVDLRDWGEVKSLLGLTAVTSTWRSVDKMPTLIVKEEKTK